MSFNDHYIIWYVPAPTIEIYLKKKQNSKNVNKAHQMKTKRIQQPPTPIKYKRTTLQTTHLHTITLYYTTQKQKYITYKLARAIIFVSSLL